MALRLLVGCLFACTCAASALGAEPGTATAAPPENPAARLYDTASRAVKPLPPETVALCDGWTLVEPGQKDHQFKGDAALVNDRLAAVLRHASGGMEVYSIAAGKATPRAVLVPLADADGEGGRGIKLAALQVLENSDGAVSVAATVETATGGKSVLAVTLAAGGVAVKTTPRSGVRKVRVESPSRFGVVPDFFADDVVIDAAAVPVDRSQVPGENFFLNMHENGAAVVLTIWDKGEEDLDLTISGKDGDRTVSGVNVPIGRDGSVWLAVMEEKGIWKHLEMKAENVRKPVAFEGFLPFPAKWKANLVRSDRTTDSWAFLEHPTNRSMWATAIGRYVYPCWIDGKPGELVARVETQSADYVGPAIAYPIDRTKDTPLDKLTVVDVMRQCLGVGPCEYIIDMAGQTVGSKGLYTCAAYDLLVPIFQIGREKDERVLVDQILKDTCVFVHAIRNRILDFVRFGDETLKYLGEQKKTHPEFAEFITKMEDITKEIRVRYDRKKGAATADVDKLADQLRESIMMDIPKVSGERIMAAIRDSIGAPQDDLVAECRIVVKKLRQAAALDMAMNPQVADIATELRKRTHEILRNKLGHEGR